jgi:hypothetical protein
MGLQGLKMQRNCLPVSAAIGPPMTGW